jgi:hypothetical protein
LKTFSSKKVFVLALMVVVTQLLIACAREPEAPRSTSYIFATATPTLTPPFQAVPNITPTATPTPINPTETPLPTATLPPTPIVAPTPVKPVETVLSNNELGIAGWTDTRVSWSPDGMHYVLQIINEPDSLDFYFLIRPPASIVASYRLSRTAYNTFAWSANGQYLSYIAQDSEGNAGAVRLIDTQGSAQAPTEVFRGPCTSAGWLGADKLIATCGTNVFNLDISRKNQPENIFKLDENGRFPGAPTPLNLVARSLPSPDGKTIAVFGLQRAPANSTKPPIGEVGFLDVETRKFSVLDRNNRPVAPVEWTPDSKFLILRNITADWNVAYTFDFYLADPQKLKISQNLSKSNPDCDPVLAKQDCQGIKPSPYQTSSILFSPDSTRYLITGIKYTSRPTIGLQEQPQVFVGTTKDGKLTKLSEPSVGNKLTGTQWLSGNRYFFSTVGENGGARVFIDNKQVSVAPVLVQTKVSGIDEGGSVRLYQAPATPAPTTEPVVIIATNPPETPAPTRTPSPTSPPGTTVPANTPAISPTGSLITAVPNLLTPEATPSPRPTLPPLPTNSPTPALSAKSPVVFGYFLSPKTNWLIAIERIASAGKPVQFQLRLLPFTLK